MARSFLGVFLSVLALPTVAGAEDSWAATTVTDAPAARASHTAAWTGTKMIVWGGLNEPGGTVEYLDTGGVWDSATDTWTGMSTINAPDAQAGHRAIWTGSRMIIWNNDAGGIYDPVTDTWTGMSTNAPDARSPSAIWTGSKMIIWGGNVLAPPPFGTVNTGGVYDPAKDTWTATSLTNVPDARYVHSAVWTGNKMIVWGGSDQTSAFATGVSTIRPQTPGRRHL